MKIETKETVITKMENDTFNINDIEIGNKKYTIIINNYESLSISFVEEGKYSNIREFSIKISQDYGIKIERTVHRPNHDHNDFQVFHSKNNEWIPYTKGYSENVEIPFGSITVKY